MAGKKKKITFQPNDVGAHPRLKPVPRVRAERTKSKARFSTPRPVPRPKFYPLTSKKFVFWQAWQAAHEAIAAWETATSEPQLEWETKRNKLKIHAHSGIGYAATYGRGEIRFQTKVRGQDTLYVGASADITAHEVGHAILDKLRPDLWSDAAHEVAAFHEAFGDCVALVTALMSDAQRKLILEIGPESDHFAQRIGKSVSSAIKADRGSSDPSSAPRRARNPFKWKPPGKLPTKGPPSDLTAEPHSFSRVFTACFHDLILAIFKTTAQDSSGLRTAAVVAAKLLHEGARTAPVAARFFESVGEAMLAHDATAGGGHGALIRAAFSARGISVDGVAPPPRVVKGSPPDAKSHGLGMLPKETRHSVARVLLGSSGAPLVATEASVGRRDVVRARGRVPVKLGRIRHSLRGVVAMSATSALVADAGGNAAIVSRFATPKVTCESVCTLVRSLAATAAISGIDEDPKRGPHTHAIRTYSGVRRLIRLRFCCHHLG